MKKKTALPLNTISTLYLVIETFPFFQSTHSPTGPEVSLHSDKRLDPITFTSRRDAEVYANRKSTLDIKLSVMSLYFFELRHLMKKMHRNG